MTTHLLLVGLQPAEQFIQAFVIPRYPSKIFSSFFHSEILDRKDKKSVVFKENDLYHSSGHNLQSATTQCTPIFSASER